MLASLTLPEGNFIRPGTILGDVLQYNATRSTTTSKLAQTSDISGENAEGGSKYPTRSSFFFIWFSSRNNKKLKLYSSIRKDFASFEAKA